MVNLATLIRPVVLVVIVEGRWVANVYMHSTISTIIVNNQIIIIVVRFKHVHASQEEGFPYQFTWTHLKSGYLMGL